MLLKRVTNAACGKESAMDQVLERRPAPEAIPEIEATLNYFVNDGSPQAAAPSVQRAA